MDLLTFALISLVVYSGLLFGALLSYWVKEELKPGEHYFKLAKRFIYFVLIATTCLIVGIEQWMVMLAIFLLLVVAYVKFMDSRYIQVFLGVILYYFRNHELFAIVASLIFIFNFPTATLMIQKAIKKGLVDRQKVIMSILVTHLWFFVGVVFFLFNIN